jgi:hypothetical protein
MSNGFGVTISVDVGTVLTAVVKVINATWPKQVAESEDNTNHDATSGYRTKIKTGVFELQPFTITVEWVASESTHAALLTALNSESAVSFSIADGGSAESMAFEANVVGLQRVTPLSGVFTADVDIEPTAAPTIT